MPCRRSLPSLYGNIGRASFPLPCPPTPRIVVLSLSTQLTVNVQTGSAGIVSPRNDYLLLSGRITPLGFLNTPGCTTMALAGHHVWLQSEAAMGAYCRVGSCSSHRNLFLHFILVNFSGPLQTQRERLGERRRVWVGLRPGAVTKTLQDIARANSLTRSSQPLTSRDDAPTSNAGVISG